MYAQSGDQNPLLLFYDTKPSHHFLVVVTDAFGTKGQRTKFNDACVKRNTAALQSSRKRLKRSLDLVVAEPPPPACFDVCFKEAAGRKEKEIEIPMTRVARHNVSNIESLKNMVAGKLRGDDIEHPEMMLMYADGISAESFLRKKQRKITLQLRETYLSKLSISRMILCSFKTNCVTLA